MALPQLHWLRAPCWPETSVRAPAPPDHWRETGCRARANVTCCSSSARASSAVARELMKWAATPGRRCLKPRRRVSETDQCRAGIQGESSFDIRRLELYTEKMKSEVLLVSAEVDGEEDEVLVFRGFSSSLMRPTATDPGEPVLPPTAKVASIDRIKGPFNPGSIEYIQQGLSWEEFDAVLTESSL